jgi:hypothetical protein
MAWTGTPLPLPLCIYFTGIPFTAVKYPKGVLNSVIQGDKKSLYTIITSHTFLASLLGSVWLLGGRPPGSGGH